MNPFEPGVPETLIEHLKQDLAREWRRVDDWLGPVIDGHLLAKSEEKAAVHTGVAWGYAVVIEWLQQFTDVGRSSR